MLHVVFMSLRMIMMLLLFAVDVAVYVECYDVIDAFYLRFLFACRCCQCC